MLDFTSCNDENIDASHFRQSITLASRVMVATTVRALTPLRPMSSMTPTTCVERALAVTSYSIFESENHCSDVLKRRPSSCASDGLMCLGTDSAGARMLPGLNSSLLGYNGQTVEGHTVKNAHKCIQTHGLTCLPISLSVFLSRA